MLFPVLINEAVVFLSGMRRRAHMPQWPKWLMALACIMLMGRGDPVQAQARETLGPGDSVRITVFQNPDLTTETRIAGHGAITFPLIGEVKIGGLSAAAASQRIADRLREGSFVRNPQVNIAVLTVRSRQVSVLGQVVHPGRYALDDTSSRLSDVLALAGGIAPGGDDTVVVMSNRGGKTVRQEIDVPRMYRSGDLARNIEVENGDTIFVQRAPVFYIYGEVARSGAYRVEPNMTVMQALSAGGGLTPRGTDRGIKINRKGTDGGVRKIDAQLSDRVQADDVIYIKESLF